MRSGKIDTVYDFTDKGLHELESWLEPWFRDKPNNVNIQDGNLGVPIEDAYKIPGANLQYWYRLGEIGPWPVDATSTPDFALDSSGNNHHLAALNDMTVDPDTFVYITDPESDELPDCNVVGALEGGSANDGGIRFNSTAGGFDRIHLCLAGGGQMEVSLRGGSSPIGTASTFSAWIACSDHVASFVPLISTWNRSFGIGNFGVKLHFNDGHMRYEVGALNSVTGFVWESDFSSVINQWHHFVTSIEKIGTDTYHRRLWVDTNKLIDETGTQVDTGSQSANGAGLTIGGGKTDDIRFYHSKGKVDEVAYWLGALTDAQVIDLYNARVYNDGETWGSAATLAGVLQEKGDLITATAPSIAARLPVGSDGQVLTADAAQELGIKWAAGGYQPPSTLPEIPAVPTAQDVADALVALGLATQL